MEEGIKSSKKGENGFNASALSMLHDHKTSLLPGNAVKPTEDNLSGKGLPSVGEASLVHTLVALPIQSSNSLSSAPLMQVKTLLYMEAVSHNYISRNWQRSRGDIMPQCILSAVIAGRRQLLFGHQRH